MTDFNFELIFKLTDGENPENYIDALYDAGCDDATLSTGAPGYIGLKFTRESDNVIDAVTSAIENVKEAISHAELERAEPFLQNLTELAFEFGFTKQNLQKYASGNASKKLAPFPHPYIKGKTSYWKVSAIALWLHEEGIVDIKPDDIDTYLAIDALNLVIEKHRQSSSDILNKLEKKLRVA